VVSIATSGDLVAIEDVACYLVRAPLSLKKLHHARPRTPGPEPAAAGKAAAAPDLVRVPVDDEGREIQAG